MTSGIVRGWWVRPHPSGDVECSVENVRNSRGVEEGALEVVRALPDLQPKPRARASRPELACAWHGSALVNLGARARASVRECAAARGRMADAGGDPPLSGPIHTLLHRPHESAAARAVVSVSPPRTTTHPPAAPPAAQFRPFPGRRKGRFRAAAFPCRRAPVPGQRHGSAVGPATAPTLARWSESQSPQPPGVHFSE